MATDLPWQAGVIERRSVAALRRHPRNARTHPPEQIEQLVAAIRQFGWTNPLLVDEAGEVIAGHGRLDAAVVLGLEDVPVIVRAGLSEAEKTALRLADNKIALNSGWDQDLLAAELGALRDGGEIDTLLTGFDDDEVDKLLGAMEEKAEAEAKPARLRDVSAEAQFWISIQGPLSHQPEVLAVLRQLAKLPGVQVASNVHE